MLERIRGIRHACDLDLLLFFYRHPRALLTGERLVSVLGYDREQLAKSLDGLIEAGLLTRSQNPSHAARLYVLKPAGDGNPVGGWLASLLKVAETRDGRAAVLAALHDRQAPEPTALARPVREARPVRVEVAHA